MEKGVFHRLGDKGKNISTYSDDSMRQSYPQCVWKSRAKIRPIRITTKERYEKKNSVQEAREGCIPLARRQGEEYIHILGLLKASVRAKVVQEDTRSHDPKSKGQALRMAIYPSHGGDLEDHLKIFQVAAKVERWAMPTWFHMFNSILTGSARVWFDDLPPESVDSYDDLKEAFMANFRQ
ncbi:hypothetical protein Tco_1165337 [Tanacetum coccineum]